VVLPTRVETVVFGFFPAPDVLVMVVLPDFVRVVTRVPDFVDRIVVLPDTIQITSFVESSYHKWFSVKI